LKRQDKLLLERALRALEDVDQSKDFSATASLRSSERATQRSNFASAIVGALWDALSISTFGSQPCRREQAWPFFE
jgi:hypothetical protein